jgi:hypothetical protein
MCFCVPCYLDYVCSLERDLSLSLHADSEERRLIRETEMNDHFLSRLINGRKFISYNALIESHVRVISLHQKNSLLSHYDIFVTFSKPFLSALNIDFKIKVTEDFTATG